MTEVARSVAVIVTVPGIMPVARPFVSMVATVRFDETQVTKEVISCVLLSENVPVAVNGCVNPSMMEGLAGVRAMEVTTGGVTVRLAVRLSEPDTIVMEVVPAATLVARPPAKIVATEKSDEAHVTEAVIFWLVPSL